MDEDINGKRKDEDSGNKIPKQVKRFENETTIDQIAREFFGGDWGKVTRLNIYKFSYLCKFLVHKRTEEQNAMKLASKKRR